MSALAKRSDRFTETDIDEEIVVMRLDNGEFFSLAGTAAVTWRLIDGTRDRGALLAALADDYDVGEASIESDVDEFLQQLKDGGLIVEA